MRGVIIKLKAIVPIVLLLLFFVVGCSADEQVKPGTTLHYSGKGKVFEVGVNTTIGKYMELFIGPKDKSQIQNVKYELKCKNGLISSGTISIDSTGFNISDIGLYNNIERREVMTIKLDWDGKTETITIKPKSSNW